MTTYDRKATYAAIRARLAAPAPAPPAPTVDDDEGYEPPRDLDAEDYAHDRAYDRSKVSDDEVREQAEGWRR